MVFSDPVFLFAFLPTLLLTFWIGGWRRRNALIVLAGGVFYTWGGGRFLLLIASSIVINHVAAKLIHARRTSSPVVATWIKRGAVSANLVALGVWKYAGFASEQLAGLLNSLGFGPSPTISLALPIAISFVTFQSISYVVDVHRGTAEPARHLVDYASYILLFPHLIAGPIVRYAEIEHDLLSKPVRRWHDFAEGAPRFFWGLGKKILIADQVAAIADHAFALPNNQVTWSVAWLGAVAYAIQIYFDFSGYSDMAIGLARMFGLRFPENFDHPYGAKSITDFWRRWHISLSSWFRDYLYIPLGGNRNGKWRTYRNLALVFLLTGMWHGANWTFVAWGLFHGAFLIGERLAHLESPEGRVRTPIRRLLTFSVVCVGWVLFRAVDLAQGWRFMSSMLLPRGFDTPETLLEIITSQRLLWFALGLLVVLLPQRAHLGRAISNSSTTTAHVLRLSAVLLIGPISMLYALSSTFSPFLYFKF